MKQHRRLVVGFGLALAMAVGAGRVVLNDGVLDGLCALVEKGGIIWIQLGCVDHNDPHGS